MLNALDEQLDHWVVVDCCAHERGAGAIQLLDSLWLQCHAQVMN